MPSKPNVCHPKESKCGNPGGNKIPSFQGCLPFPFFPGMLLSRKPPETRGTLLFVEKNDGRNEWKRTQPPDSFRFSLAWNSPLVRLLRLLRLTRVARLMRLAPNGSSRRSSLEELSSHGMVQTDFQGAGQLKPMGWFKLIPGSQLEKPRFL